MYSPRVIAYRREQFERTYHRQLPYGLVEHSVDEVAAFVEDQQRLTDKKGRVTRELTPVEREFIFHEQLWAQISFPYWAERYAHIVLAGAKIGRLYPLWPSQDLILRKLGQLEERNVFDGSPHGIIPTILKARQLGASTLSEALVTHRVTTRPAVQAIIASDAIDSSARMFRMAERTIRRLPAYMCPAIVGDVKNEELEFETGSRLETGAGKSTRGKEGARGQIGRSGTFSVGHLTELSTWENLTQIFDALFPAIPIAPTTLVILESTAKGRNNDWHTVWKLAVNGRGPHGHVFTPVFIPWYAVPDKNWLPSPEGWEPSDVTKMVAEKIRQTSERWVGVRIEPTREQLYWYESGRATAEYQEENDSPGALAKFLEEQATDPEEAFQHTGHSVFPILVRDRHRAAARPLLAAFELMPAKDLAFQWGRRPALDYDRALHQAIKARGIDPAAWDDPLTGRAPTITPQMAAFNPETDPIYLPKGMALRRLSPPEMAALHNARSLDDLEGLVLMWEAPRRKQFYVIAGDVAQGQGGDRTGATVLRVGTVNDPDEEVAQICSRWMDAVDLAYAIDCLGRLYKGKDDLPALVGIECNGLGLHAQSTLINQFGYDNIFMWEYEDAATPEGRFTRKFGWWTTVRTRPLIIGRLIRAVKTVDPVTKLPDVRINSPFTLEELNDFTKPPGKALHEAEAARGANDDALLQLAVCIHLAQKLQFDYGGGESVAERRRRVSEEKFREHVAAEALGIEADPRHAQNTDVTERESSRSALDWDDDEEYEHIW